jgi:ATP-dependent Clp protease protease subunit
MNFIKKTLTLIAILAVIPVGTFIAYKASHAGKSQFQSAFSNPAPQNAPNASNPNQAKKAEATNQSSEVIKDSKSKQEVLILTAKNTVVLDDVVTYSSVAKVQVELAEMSEKLDEDETIYLVLNTPGGSVSAGMALIDSIKALPQKVKTLTIFAASMGFQIAQNLDERLITPSGVLMSHRARVSGMDGEVGGELDVRLKALHAQIRYLDQIAADRMSISLESYRSLIADEYWVNGFDSVAEKAADKMLLARCDKSLNGTKEKSIATFFGNLNVTLSQCPLIEGPLKLSLNGIPLPVQTLITDYTTKLFFSKKDFVKDYIVTKRYLKVVAE